MNYKDYLNSNHWIEFRRKIYSTRKICQGCSSSKKKLNIHHRNYKSLGKETEDDIIVLCEECHNRFHNKKKWKSKMKQGESLDFTFPKDLNNKYYNLSNVLEKCLRCNKEHSLFYRRFKNGVLHLGITCPYSKPRTRWLKYIKGLDIPIISEKIPKSVNY